jgi:hypothetical protein
MLGNINDPDLQISPGAFSGFAGELNQRELRALDFRNAARRRIAEIGEPIFRGRIESETVQEDVLMLNLLTMRQTEEVAAIESARILEAHLTELLLKLDAVN